MSQKFNLKRLPKVSRNVEKDDEKNDKKDGRPYPVQTLNENEKTAEKNMIDEVNVWSEMLALSVVNLARSVNAIFKWIDDYYGPKKRYRWFDYHYNNFICNNIQLINNSINKLNQNNDINNYNAFINLIFEYSGGNNNNLKEKINDNSSINSKYSSINNNNSNNIRNIVFKSNFNGDDGNNNNNKKLFTKYDDDVICDKLFCRTCHLACDKYYYVVNKNNKLYDRCFHCGHSRNSHLRIGIDDNHISFIESNCYGGGQCRNNLHTSNNNSIINFNNHNDLNDDDDDDDDDDEDDDQQKNDKEKENKENEQFVKEFDNMKLVDQ